MTTLAMNDAEIKSIDTQVEQMMDWAKTHRAEAEQLAMDSARLMACTGDRLDRIKNQGFFKRCWNRFTGKTGEMERANTSDLISMQKMAFRYVNMLQEQQMLMAHSLLALKNNLVSLAVKEEETRNMIGELAQRTLERFESLESRVDQLEISTNLQGWLLGLEERDYDEKFPTDYMRLFRVINDFYQIKKDGWNFNDLMFMRKAIRTVGLNPKQKISLNTFIDRLVDEIQSDKVGFDAYGTAITQFVPKGVDNYSKYALENVSSPVFVALHGLKTQYQDRLDMVEELQDEMNISASEALKRLLRRSIKNLNVDMDYEFPLAETAIEILGCLRLIGQLMEPAVIAETEVKEVVVEEHFEQKKQKQEVKKIDVNNMVLGSWNQCKNLPRGNVEWVIPNNENFFVCLSEQQGEDVFRAYNRMSVYTTNDFVEYKRFAEFESYPYNNSGPFFINNKLLFIGGKTSEEYEPTLFMIDKENVDTYELIDTYMDDEVIYKQIMYALDKWYIIGQYSASKGDGKLILCASNLEDVHIIKFPYKCDYKYYDIVYNGDNFATIVTPNRGEYCDDYDLITSTDMKKWNNHTLYKATCIPTDYSANIISFDKKIYFYNENNIYSMANKKISNKPYSTSPFEGRYKERYIIDCNCQKYGIALCVSDENLYVSNDLKKWIKIDVNFSSAPISGNFLGSIFGSTSKNENYNHYTYAFGKLVFWRGDNIFFRTME